MGAEGGGQGAGGGLRLAVGVVGVADHGGAGGVYDVEDVALEVGDVVVEGAVVLQGVGIAAGIVEEVQGVSAAGLAHQLAACVGVAVGGTAYLLGQPQAIGIVGEAEALAVAVGRHQPPALGPGHGPILAVVIGGGIAGSVIGNGVSVVFRQQVPPGGIAVGVGVAGGAVGGGQNIAHRVVGIGVGLSAAGLLRQLVLGIVGIGVGGAVFRVGGNISQNIIGIAVGDVRGKIVLQLRNLGGGICGGDIPVGVGLSVDAASNRGKPLQGIIPVGQRIAYRRFVGSQQAGCLTVSVGFRIIGASQLPVLSGQLVVGIIGLPGGQHSSGAVPDRTGHEPSQGVVAVLIGQTLILSCTE